MDTNTAQVKTNQGQTVAAVDVKPSSADQQAKFLAAFDTPISFFGKVVDENGKAVADAVVELDAADKAWEDGSKYRKTSDENGLFSITGIHGAGLAVFVSKENYYNTPESKQMFRYSNPENGDPTLPTSDNPAIIVLRKKGDAAALLVFGGSFTFPKDGTPIAVKIGNKQPVAIDQGDLTVQCWSHDENKNAKGRFDWQCRISIRDGGLVLRTNQFDFEAPIGGYEPFDEINMPQSVDRWRPQVQREYFLKFDDSRFARIRFEVIASGDHFFTITSYLNPVLGNRNLEFDPQK